MVLHGCVLLFVFRVSERFGGGFSVVILDFFLYFGGVVVFRRCGGLFHFCRVFRVLFCLLV